jgi:hypothetical protein
MDTKFILSNGKKVRVSDRSNNNIVKMINRFITDSSNKIDVVEEIKLK